jgi:hypothetical protein
MPAVQQWGRKESIIWPPGRYLYTLGALFLALVVTGFFIYVRFQYGLSPLERYYLPYYLRTEMAVLTHPASAYQLLYVSDGKSGARVALEADVEPGLTQQFTGKPLPLAVSSQALQNGFRLLFREQPRTYSNKALHTWIEHWVYADVPASKLFTMQLVFGLVAFALQLPFSIRRDIQRIKGLRYGRRLKGPVLVNAKDFTKAVSGNGIGIATNDAKLPLRIPRDAENKHFLIVGDTGSGKSSIIRQMLYQVKTYSARRIASKESKGSPARARRPRSRSSAAPRKGKAIRLRASPRPHAPRGNLKRQVSKLEPCKPSSPALRIQTYENKTTSTLSMNRVSPARTRCASFLPGLVPMTASF